MGNGALPNGPSYRAHPRLYPVASPSNFARLICSFSNTCPKFFDFSTLLEAAGLVEPASGKETAPARGRAETVRLGSARQASAPDYSKAGLGISSKNTVACFGTASGLIRSASKNKAVGQYNAKRPCHPGH